MPTVVTKTIGATSSPTTPDYTSIQAWEDALPADLVSGDTQQIGECLNQGEFVEDVTISGQTTDATRNIILRCATGASFADNAGVATNPLIYDATKGVALRSTGSIVPAVNVGTNYVTVQGLQIHRTGDYSYVLASSGNATVVDSCILQATNTGNNPAVSLGANDSGAKKLVNCLVVRTGSNSLSGLVVLFGGSVLNCTFVRPADGTPGGTAINTAYGAMTIKNTAVFGWTTFAAGSDSGSGYNATDLGTAFGSNNQTSLTYANQFENNASIAAGDFRAKSTGGLQAGTPDATNAPDDIRGLTRDATTPWIGCWEIGASGPPPNTALVFLIRG